MSARLEPDPGGTTPRSWGNVLAIAGVGLLGALFAAFAIEGAGAALRSHDTAAPVTTTVPATIPAAALPPISTANAAEPTEAEVEAPTTTITTVPPPRTVTVTPPPPTVTITEAPPDTSSYVPTVAADAGDPLFHSLVSQIPGLVIYDWNQAESGGRQICAFLSQGHSRRDAAKEITRENATVARWQAKDYVNAAIAAYCPGS